MEYSKVVTERRSVRKFLDKDISMDTLKSIIDEVRYSPSWKNSQPVRYVIIKDKQVKELIAKNATNNFTHNERIIDGCNTLVIICTLPTQMNKEALTDEERNHWLSFDAGIATQSFCLSCYNKGISSVILGIFNEDKIKEIANIGSECKIQALVPIGYSDVTNAAPTRLDVDQLVVVNRTVSNYEACCVCTNICR